MSTYYGKGTKEKIISYIAGEITKITGVTFVDYQRSYDTGIGPEKMPGAFVNDVYEEKRQVLADVVRNTLQVGVVCWVRATEAEGLWEKLDGFIQSILAAVRKDSTLGNQAYSATISRVATDSGSRHPVGVAVIMVEVTYFSGV